MLSLKLWKASKLAQTITIFFWVLIVVAVFLNPTLRRYILRFYESYLLFAFYAVCGVNPYEVIILKPFRNFYYFLGQLFLPIKILFKKILAAFFTNYAGKPFIICILAGGLLLIGYEAWPVKQQDKTYANPQAEKCEIEAYRTYARLSLMLLNKENTAIRSNQPTFDITLTRRRLEEEYCSKFALCEILNNPHRQEAPQTTRNENKPTFDEYINQQSTIQELTQNYKPVKYSILFDRCLDDEKLEETEDGK